MIGTLRKVMFKYSPLLLVAVVALLRLTATQAAASDIVLYASEATTRAGNWAVVADSTAAGGARMANADLGGAKLATALVAPASYFEMSFNAQSNVPYRLWVRGKAQNDSPYNDSFFVQFSGSVTSTGSAVYRIGTTDGTCINLEEASGYGLSGWGWQDNGWGMGVMGPVIYFASTGTQTLRLQPREDGFSIDQIVLSPATYLNTSPGALKNDTTILSKSGGTGANPAPTVSGISPNSGPIAGGTSVTISGSNFASGASVTIGGTAASNVVASSSTTVTATAPAHVAGVVSVAVTNPDGQSAPLANGFTYQSPLPAPAPTVSGISPNSGTTSGGTSVTISGTNFVSGASVTMGGTAASNVVVSSSTTMTAVTGAHAAGAVNVVVSNADGQSGTLAGGFTYTAPTTSASTIVVWASNVASSSLNGAFSKDFDATAAGTTVLHNPDAGLPKLGAPLANPAAYFEVSFNAQANTPYHLWVRSKADANSPYNDSFFVQFSGSVTSTGSAVYRIGTTDGTCINLEEASGYGLSGWGWQDNGWGADVMGSNIYFASTGLQTLRLQPREDGFSIDQIVLSPATYLNTSPGALKNDTTILPSTLGGTPPANLPPAVTVSASPAAGIAPLSVNFSTTASDPDGYIVSYNWIFGDGQTATQATPSHLYSAAGSYLARLTVTDNQGATASASVVVTANPPASSGATIKVMTWNSQFNKGTDNVEDLDRQATWIVNMGADVVGMYEMPNYAGDNHAQRIRDLLVQKTGVSWSYYWIGKFAGCTEGNVIYTKGTILSTSYVYMSYQRSVAQATISIYGKVINFFVTHLDDASTTARLQEVTELKSFANSFAEPRIIVGDFNFSPDWPEMAGMTSDYYDGWNEAFIAGMASAYPDNPVAWQTRTRRGRIDYVFYSHGAGNLTLRAAQIPDQRDLSRPAIETIGTADDRGVRPSDHNFMTATFDLR